MNVSLSHMLFHASGQSSAQMIWTISGHFPGLAVDPPAQIGLGSSKDLCAGVQFQCVARRIALNLPVCALLHLGLPLCDFPEEDALF